MLIWMILSYQVELLLPILQCRKISKMNGKAMNEIERGNPGLRMNIQHVHLFSILI